MSATPYAVVDAFKAGQYKRQGNFYTTGDAIFTYGVKLAGKHADGTPYVTAAMVKKYSKTSSTHQKAVRESLPDATPFYSDWSKETFGTLGNPPTAAGLPFTERQ